MSMRSAPALLASVSLLLLTPCPPGAARAAAPPVEARIEPLVIPTWGTAPADPNPRFYAGRVYQGAQASFYPYAVQDRLTETRAPKTWTAVRLENRWIDVTILPELGGRIFSARDKTNGYDFFYRQHVIKPALIGMLGAWISGGVEWNVPHHHRATSFQPVDWMVEEGEDGSRTVWVGETEWRHRLRWTVGIRLRPDRSWIELDVRISNPTPLAHSFLFWINPAVHANDDYQVVFPPSTEFAVQHGKPEFARWPIADGRYAGVDYAGVDISWWKSHPQPVSFFAHESKEDFFGGYDHGKRAGVLHVANHHVVPGKKFFEWGKGPQGDLWEKILTETDGPYLELMAGAWSDNQPDYSWLQPGEVKAFRHVWYPVRDLGAAKNANDDAAVNLEVADGVARLALNATSELHGARVVLEAGGRPIFEATATISPERPFGADVPIPPGVDPGDLRAVLLAASGAEVVSYRPLARKAPSPMPRPVERPGPPADVPTTEDLYLTGLRVDQLYSPAADPEPYWEEALRRDPGDYRSNVALALRRLKGMRYAEAEGLLRAAVARAAGNYIRPKDGEAFYYLGVALRRQGKADEARDALWKAAWSQAWKAPAYRALAEMACAAGRLEESLDLIERSLQANGVDPGALCLKAAIARRVGKPEAAREAIARAQGVDPLDPRPLQEIVLFFRATPPERAFPQEALSLPIDAESSKRLHAEVLRQLADAGLRSIRDPRAWIEVAVGYANAGLLDDAASILEHGIEASTRAGGVPDPLVHYHLAAWLETLGRAEDARTHRLLAAAAPSDYCFPFRWESEASLLDAVARSPADPRAPHYLGNLLYDHQPERAIQAWEASVRLDPGFAPAWRNLSVGYAQARGDLPRAIASAEKAVALSPSDPRLLFELDRLHEEANTPIERRLEALGRSPEVLALRDDAWTRRIVVCTRAGALDEAVSMLRSRRFHNWEGRGEIHDVYRDAVLERGRKRLRAGDPGGALEDFEAALDYPENLEVGRPRRDRREAEVRWWIGAAREAAGDATAARLEWERAAALGEGGVPEARYAAGLALRKLGRDEEARKAFEALVDQGKRDLEAAAAIDFFDKFGERTSDRERKARARYLLGLGLRGLGEEEEARKELERALAIDVSHLGARAQLDEPKP